MDIEGKSTAVRKTEHIFSYGSKFIAKSKQESFYSKPKVPPVLLLAYLSNAIVEKKIVLGRILSE